MEFTPNVVLQIEKENCFELANISKYFSNICTTVAPLWWWNNPDLQMLTAYLETGTETDTIIQRK